VPIFEYQRMNCGKVIEVLEQRSEKVKHACPECGGSPMEKKFSAFGIEKAKSHSAGSCPQSGSCAGGTCPFN